MNMVENETGTNNMESAPTTAVMMTIMMNSNSNLSILNDALVINQMQPQHIQLQQQQQQLQSNQHYLVSNNSFELNTATSLSDDSGILHTNSSISSSGSSRLGLCRFEFELAESDGEASQFDSLDNCSDGGMSAENFNTLKKVPIAPIDPPPEFQDSPQTTLLRSQVLQNYALKLARNLIENACCIYAKLPDSLKYNQNIDEDNNDNKNSDINNIYDEPPPLIVNTINSNNSNSNTISSNTSIHSRVKLKKILYSPLHHGSNLSTINRPNSRNSLNSRLSSSHNSLSVNTTNKVDDSIFITQAMSHDALLGKEIIDFYNVPIDSDIYTLPIDFINKQSINNSFNNNESGFLFQQPNQQHTINKSSSIITNAIKNSKIHRNTKLKYNKNNLFNYNSNNKNSNANNINKKRRKGCGISNGTVVGVNDKYTNKPKLIKSNDKRHSVPENLIEPMHMTLDEVKRYYHSLYSSSSDSQENVNNNNNISNSNSNSSKFIHLNNTTRKSSSNHTVCNTITPTSFISTSSTTSTINTKLSSSYVNTNSGNNNNNNNNVHIHNHHGQSNKISKLNKSSKNGLKKLKEVEYREQSRQSASVIPSNSIGTNTSSTGMGVVGANSTSSIVTVSSDVDAQQSTNLNHLHHKKSSQFSINLNLKQKFCSIFRFRNKNHSSSNTTNNNHGHNTNNNNNNNEGPGIDYGMTRDNNDDDSVINSKKIKFPTRALPPLPPRVSIINNNNNNTNNNNNLTIKNKNNKIFESLITTQPHSVIERPIPNSTIIDFATNIEKVKECGWYWGPISGEAAEKILSNEPDGSFIVRDSSDDHYIFSITFKLSGCIRHVRIDQDQGEFSFGSRALFKSRTITEFIENAVEHSRSGRYLFFLHRRPEHGPMRVQLTNPVSRFRHIQSLQHMCRFVILKAVRKDLIRNLPLPRRLLDYLSYKNYYSEQIESDSPQSQLSGDGSTS